MSPTPERRHRDLRGPMWTDLCRHRGGRSPVPLGTGERSPARRLAAAGLGLVFALFAVIAGPAVPAYAHAQLVDTSPANGARLQAPPPEVVLRFTEPVTPVRDGVRLLDQAGKVRDGGPARTDRGAATRVILPVPAGLGTGVYTVSWRVVSADSHPIHGAFVFGVGQTPVDARSGGGARTDAAGPVTVLFSLLRWLGYAALAVFAGGIAFLFLCWPAGWAQPRARRLLGYGWGASVFCAAGVLLLQGPYATGAPLSGLADPTLLTDTLATGYGRYVLARIVLLVTAGVVLLRLVVRPTASTVDTGPVPGRVRTAVLVLCAALPVTWVGTGHANAGQTLLAGTADAAHLGAMAVWLGGLVFLASCVLSRSAPAGALAAAGTLARFSRIAAGCVAVLVVTGGYQAWRGVGSLDALAGSRYGTLLVFKLAFVGILLWLGAMSRSVVQRRYVRPALRRAEPEPVAASAVPALANTTAGGRAAGRRARSAVHARVDPVSTPGRAVRAGGRGRDHAPVDRRRRADRERDEQAHRHLRWSVRIEVAVASAVLGLTSILVATPPGARPPAPQAPAGAPQPAAGAPRPAAGAPEAPVVAAAELDLTGGGRLTARLEPARVGPATLTLIVQDGAGRLWDVPEVSADLLLPERNLGPVPAPLAKLGPGRYATDGLTVPAAGRWRLRITVRTSDFDETTVATDMLVS
jgi:copper transport protein